MHSTKRVLRFKYILNITILDADESVLQDVPREVIAGNVEEMQQIFTARCGLKLKKDSKGQWYIYDKDSKFKLAYVFLIRR